MTTKQNQDNNEVILEINDLNVEYKSERATAKALNGVSLKLCKGESLGLVGESGAGKTTTALSILEPFARECSQGYEVEILSSTGKSVFSMKKVSWRICEAEKLLWFFRIH
ncbi:MAG: ATP-binding cassette domain-containing protein [Anaerobutyricum soehngenii]